LAVVRRDAGATMSWQARQHQHFHPPSLRTQPGAAQAAHPGRL